MKNLAISVLIPLYNRKHYTEACIDSVLTQTFQDFEIIIRDDCSTDGVFEFVQEKFSRQISDGKIKLFRNEKNLGENLTTKKLCEQAQGKYFTILHNDDLYLPHALKYFFEVAEKFQADVVHSTKFLTSESDGIIEPGSRLHLISKDNNPVKQVEVMSNDSMFRFNEWWQGGTFQDIQYNIFRTDFCKENILSDLENSDTFLVALKWIMQAKIFVKAPEAVYIHRDCQDSQTYENEVSEGRLDRTIVNNILLFHQIDKFLSEYEFFHDKQDLQYLVKAKIFMAVESLRNDDKNFGKKSYAALYNSIEKVFKKYFDEKAVYLALLYHWSHIIHFNSKRAEQILQDCLKTLIEEI